MATELRKRAPFTCRYKDPGQDKLTCLRVLTEAEGDLCTAHQAVVNSAVQAFFEKPIEGAKPEPEAEDSGWKNGHWTRGPIWPVDEAVAA